MTNTNRYQTLTLANPEDAKLFHVGMRVRLSKGPWWRRVLSYLVELFVPSARLYVCRTDPRRGTVTVARDE